MTAKLHYRGPQIGKATAFAAIEAPGADKRELIKNKNLIKLQQQQLQGSNAACKGSLFIRQSHETHYRTVGRRNNMADIDQREGSSLNTHGRRRRCTCQNIDEIYPISDSDAFHFEARVSPLRERGGECRTVMIARLSSLVG